ncbi:MAG: 4-hydroxy-tetrahydrodipicolinate synthase [Myxococcales bacterium]|nr:4-hydroxy-tetrahydrodipicolinate synthase [Myxococcales bacterium]
MFAGVHTAIVTPFCDGRFDREAHAALVERQIVAGIDGLVPCGTTGESSTLSDEERLQVIGDTVALAKGRCQVIAGVGTNDTAQSIRLARRAAELGADGALVITPYYNKPTQEGLFHHFRAIAEAVPGLPLMLYNVPSRTGIDLLPETVDRLADVPGVVALKEATANMVVGARIAAATSDRLTLLSGDDPTALPLWAVGGRGVVSVTSNVVPDQVVALWRAFARGDIETARHLHLKLLPLSLGLFVETNPVPAKALLARLTGLCSPEVRLPLTPLLAESVARLRPICAALGLEIGA